MHEKTLIGYYIGRNQTLGRCRERKRSLHGSVWPLHFQKGYDKRRSPLDYFWRDLGKRAVVDGHDVQVAA